MPRKEITAVRKNTTAAAGTSSVAFDEIEEYVRQEIRQRIQKVLEEELTEFLGRGRYERRAGGSRGYRNGHGKPRRLTMKCGTITVFLSRFRSCACRRGLYT